MLDDLADLLNILFVRLYTEDKSKDHSLMCKNTILTLGHIAVALRHELRVSLSNNRYIHRRTNSSVEFYIIFLSLGDRVNFDLLPAEVLSVPQ
jgi:hypothetical protein